MLNYLVLNSLQNGQNPTFYIYSMKIIYFYTYLYFDLKVVDFRPHNHIFRFKNLWLNKNRKYVKIIELSPHALLIFPVKLNEKIWYSPRF